MTMDKTQALEFFSEDQDDKLVLHVIKKLALDEYQLIWNDDEQYWELRGDYQTLLIIREEDGVEVSDLLINAVYFPS